MNKNGTIAPLILKSSRSLPYLGQGNEERGGWSAPFWNNHDQPRAWIALWYPELPDEGAIMPAASIHLSYVEPVYLVTGASMIDPDYDSMDYVDVESINAYQCSRSRYHLSKPLRLFKPNHVIISVRPCNGMLLNAGFSTGTPWLKVGKSYKDFNVEKEMDGPILPSIKNWFACEKKCPSFQKAATCQHWKIVKSPPFGTPLRRSKTLGTHNHFYEVKSKYSIKIH